jgi:hypothetical protein
MLSLEYQRFRECTGKVGHPSREEAEDVAERQSKKWKLGETVRLVAYRCHFCFLFHTGRQYESGLDSSGYTTGSEAYRQNVTIPRAHAGSRGRRA